MVNVKDRVGVYRSVPIADDREIGYDPKQMEKFFTSTKCPDSL